MAPPKGETLPCDGGAAPNPEGPRPGSTLLKPPSENEEDDGTGAVAGAGAGGIPNLGDPPHMLAFAAEDPP